MDTEADSRGEASCARAGPGVLRAPLGHQAFALKSAPGGAAGPPGSPGKRAREEEGLPGSSRPTLGRAGRDPGEGCDGGAGTRLEGFLDEARRAEGRGDAYAASLALAWAGNVQLEQNDLASAERTFRRVLEAYDAPGCAGDARQKREDTKWLALSGLGALGRKAGGRKALEAAETSHIEAISHAIEEGLVRQTAVSSYNLALVYSQMRRRDEMLECMEMAQATATESLSGEGLNAGLNLSADERAQLGGVAAAAKQLLLDARGGEGVEAMEAMEA